MKNCRKRSLIIIAPAGHKPCRRQLGDFFSFEGTTDASSAYEEKVNFTVEALLATTLVIESSLGDRARKRPRPLLLITNFRVLSSVVKCS